MVDGLRCQAGGEVRSQVQVKVASLSSEQGGREQADGHRLGDVKVRTGPHNWPRAEGEGAELGDSEGGVKGFCVKAH